MIADLDAPLRTQMKDFHDTATLPHSDWLVSQEELRQVSGYKQPGRIRAWLAKNGINFLMPRDGDRWPRVLRKTFQQKFSKTISEAAPVQPDLSWMRRRESK